MTLCWFCQNAVPSPATGAGCSWSRRPHTPVPGWDAKRRDVRMSSYSGDVRTVESYRVKACPEFVEDQSPAGPGPAP